MCVRQRPTVNHLFSHVYRKEEAGRDWPYRLTRGETVMHEHRNLLPMIPVKIGVKVKITVIRSKKPAGLLTGQPLPGEPLQVRSRGGGVIIAPVLGASAHPPLEDQPVAALSSHPRHSVSSSTLPDGRVQHVLTPPPIGPYHKTPIVEPAGSAGDPHSSLAFLFVKVGNRPPASAKGLG